MVCIVTVVLAIKSDCYGTIVKIKKTAVPCDPVVPHGNKKTSQKNKKGSWDKSILVIPGLVDSSTVVVDVAASQSIMLLSPAENMNGHFSNRADVHSVGFCFAFILWTSAKNFAAKVATCLIVSFVSGVISICWGNYRQWTILQVTVISSIVVDSKVECRTLMVL